MAGRPALGEAFCKHTEILLLSWLAAQMIADGNRTTGQVTSVMMLSMVFVLVIMAKSSVSSNVAGAPNYWHGTALAISFIPKRWNWHEKQHMTTDDFLCII